MARTGKELHDFQAVRKHETEKAYLLTVYVIGEGEQDVWFPKAWCQDNEDGTYTVPMHWAIEKKVV